MDIIEKAKEEIKTFERPSKTTSIELIKEVEKLRYALQDAKLFANWVECLGRTDCEIYKHELKGSADQSINRIDSALQI